MKRLNIYGAFLALSGPGTKEDIIIHVAKQQNIRFNELPQLQKEVDQALEESYRLGFIERQGNLYKLNTETPAAKNHNNSQNKSTTSKEKNQSNVERSSRQLSGQGDGKRSNSAVSTRSTPKLSPTALCSACSELDSKTNSERRKICNNLDKLLLTKETSVCSICGLNSDNSVNPDEQIEKCVWPNIRTAL